VIRKVYLGIFLSILVMLMAPKAFAISYDLKHVTPEIQKAIKNRQARYDQVQEFKAKGLLGENRVGFVEVLGASAEAGTLAKTENADRGVIYRAVVEQNNLGPAGLVQVQEAFAVVQRERANKGDPIQLPSGEWVKK